jgi:hypothetical protein
MNTHAITWKKDYYEDLGKQDENGFPEYAYCYSIYSFYFHDKQEVNVRRYTDTMYECSIFFNNDNPKDGEFIEEATIISVVIHFMETTQGVRHCSYFDTKSGYTHVSMNETENVLSSFSFIELE